MAVVLTVGWLKSSPKGKAVLNQGKILGFVGLLKRKLPNAKADSPCKSCADTLTAPSRGSWHHPFLCRPSRTVDTATIKLSELNGENGILEWQRSGGSF